MSQTKKLKLYFTSDVHGYFYPTSYGDDERKQMGLFACAGGFARDEDTLVIDGGDILQGSAFAGYCRQVLETPETIGEIMSDCGYDYYTLGNHDFNYGQAYQRAYIQANRGRCVCQNVTDDAGRVLYPYDIRVMPNGLCVGIVGVVTDYVNIWEKQKNLVGIRVTDPFAAAKQALGEIKKQTDVTILIYHGGFERDLPSGRVLSSTTENIGYRICEELDYDILLTGHQHTSIDGQLVSGTYVVQPVENAREYHYLELTWTDGKKSIRSERMKADLCGEKQQELCKKYQSVEEAVQKWLDQPIGHLSRELRPAGKVDMALGGSPIADFLNKIQLYFSNAQLSSVGLANEIAGFRRDVSMRDVIATYPYPNSLVVCEITGAQLRTAMERSAEYFAIDDDGAVCVADSFLAPKVEHYNYDYYMGVTYEIDPRAPRGSRIKNLAYEGKNVSDSDRFTMCLNNYRYSGAGGYPVYTECKLLSEINTEMVELIVEYFHQNPYVIV